jgi:L-threonine kinase
MKPFDQPPLSPGPLSHLERDAAAPGIGAGSCPLVLGECVQGRIGDGPHFLITSPVSLLSLAEFIADTSMGRVVVEPAHYVKSLAGVLQYLGEEALPLSGMLRVHSGARTSLGFGTSTADIAASLRAAAAAWRRRISPSRISRIASRIEPSDGSMYSGSVAYAHREGRLLERFGLLPRFRAVAVICDDGVDTVEFDRHRVHFRYSDHDQKKLRMAWDMVREAERSGSVQLLAEAGTISAGINQELLPKSLFDEFQRDAGPLGAEGLFVAHSGSLLAFILDPSRPDHEARYERVLRYVTDLAFPGWMELANYQEKIR